jgi:drug/metabolite transporter (DMT)-like permease
VAAVTYTTFILASEPLSDRIDPFLFTALAMTGAAWTTGLFTLAAGGAPVGSGSLCLALLSTVVPAVAFLFGLRRLGAPTAAILSCTEVVVTRTVAWAALGDHLTPVELCGCAAVVILNRRTAPG